MRNGSLADLGFQPFFQDQIKDDSYDVGRISTAANGIYTIMTESGKIKGIALGKLHVLVLKIYPVSGTGYDSLEPIMEEKGLSTTY